MGKSARNDPILRKAIVTVASITGAALGAWAGGPVGASAGAAVGASAASLLLGPPDTELDVSPQVLHSQSQATNRILRVNQRAGIGGLVPKVWGVFRVYPKLVSEPAITEQGGNPWLTAIYDFGLGPAHIQNLKFGQSAVRESDDLRVRLVDPAHGTTVQVPGDTIQGRTIMGTFEDFTLTTITKEISGQGRTGDFTEVFELTRNRFPNGTFQMVKIYITFPKGLKVGIDGNFAMAHFEVEYKKTTEEDSEYKPVMQLFWDQATAPTTVNEYYGDSPGAHDVGSLDFPLNFTPSTDDEKREANWALKNQLNVVPFKNYSPSTSSDDSLQNFDGTPWTDPTNKMIVCYQAWAIGPGSASDPANPNAWKWMPPNEDAHYIENRRGPPNFPSHTFGVTNFRRQQENESVRPVPEDQIRNDPGRPRVYQFGESDFMLQAGNQGLIDLGPDVPIHQYPSFQALSDLYEGLPPVKSWWGFPKGQQAIPVYDSMAWYGPEELSGLTGASGWEEQFDVGWNNTATRDPIHLIKPGALVYLDLWDFRGQLPNPYSWAPPTDASNVNLRYRQWGRYVKHFPKPIGIVKKIYVSANRRKMMVVLENELARDEPIIGQPKFWTNHDAWRAVDRQGGRPTVPYSNNYDMIACMLKRSNNLLEWPRGTLDKYNEHLVDFVQKNRYFCKTIPIIFVNQNAKFISAIGTRDVPTTEAQIAFPLPRKTAETDNYTVRIKKTDSFSTAAATPGNESETALINSKSSFNVPPVNVNRSQLFLQLSRPIKPTEEDGVNRVQDNLSFDGKVNAEVLSFQRVMTTIPQGQLNAGDPIWHASIHLSTNPADLVADILTNSVNKNAITYNDLDIKSFKEYWDFCEEIPTPPPGSTFIHKRFEMGFLLDYSTTVSELLNRILAQTRAGLRYKDGKFEIFLDRTKDPVQIFTPRNSSSFQSTREYRELQDYCNVTFFDEWELNDTRAYRTADLTGEKSFDVQAFGCRSQEQAWRYGRYLLSQHQYRKETYRIKVDYEHLLCAIGDRVQIAYDQIKGGGISLV